jgi:mTERF domain-containing protein
MFPYALVVFVYHGEEKLAKKIGILESSGWSQEDLLIAMRKSPLLFTMSEERLRKNMDFLTRDVGLKVHYIAQRSVMVMYSLERRLLPRHCLLKVLDAKGLVDAQLSFFSAVTVNEKKFMEKFVLRYKDTVPSLTSTYASSCAEKVPKSYTP